MARHITVLLSKQGAMFSSFYPLSAFIAYRYAKSNKASQNSFVSFINRFSVAGIALGLMALIIVVSVMNGLEGQLKQRILGIVPHIELATPLNTQSQVVGVTASMAFREAEAVVQSRTDLRGVQIHGVEPNAMLMHTMVANKLEQGRFEDITPNSFHVVIGRALAVKLDARVGDRIRVMVAGASVYTPFGRMPSQRLVTVAGIFDMGSKMDDKVIYMHLDDVNRLLRDPKGEGISQRLFLDDAFNYLAVVEQLTESFHIDAAQIKTWRERQGPLFDAVKMEKNMMMLMLLLIIAVAAFNIVSALVMVVTEKQGDIAVLQTQGMLPSTIMWIFVLNGLFNGVKGAAIGLLLGVVVTLQLNNFLALIGSPLALSADGSGLPIEMNMVQIVSITGLSLLLCVSASIYPARKAMKIQPSQALQNE
ncbi:lipoprotein-releasing ABC transporter permease subunit [Alteromonas sp. McT4-15]|jgi:lipoprotein-releasing system permease protein|uniref:lipoprotein-releasing ABC transporter permease subunit n=1 Tax=Alteromonas sp. McT4-15 TaxID=2881256 RepID=UPI001CF8F0C0|nr:lipoprotein-releasing ABC transporter permease subunit [Alteromonas sp. McT4-15]MCB4436568.1 lipoprotein-releasing ABC transporter permease subunit [Alteromonas sp. McT4-15]